MCLHEQRDCVLYHNVITYLRTYDDTFFSYGVLTTLFVEICLQLLQLSRRISLGILPLFLKLKILHTSLPITKSLDQLFFSIVQHPLTELSCNWSNSIEKSQFWKLEPRFKKIWLFTKKLRNL